MKPRRGAGLLAGTLIVPQALLAGSTLYLLALLVAARDEARRSGRSGPTFPVEAPRLVVLIPAHDEEAGIGATLEALAACGYPAEALRKVVIADNCTDSTEERALARGVEVWARDDTTRRGKGHALGWALDRLGAEGDVYEGVVVIDADCHASPNLLEEVGSLIGQGASAVQVDYQGSNPEDSDLAALRFGALALANTVRGLGKERLGLSSGLVGSGMGFSRSLLEQVRWDATGLTEDDEYHVKLVLRGMRSRFAAGARVTSAMPASYRASASQQARWESGKAAIVRRWLPALLGRGLRARDLNALHAGVECALPPQSVIAAGSIAGLLAGSALGARGLRRLALATLAGQAAFVVFGLRLVGAPARVYWALLGVPRFLVAKLALYWRLARGDGPAQWVRTEREGGTEG